MVLSNIVSGILKSINHNDILDDVHYLNFLDDLDLSELDIDGLGDDDLFLVSVLAISVLKAAGRPYQSPFNGGSFSHGKSVISKWAWELLAGNH